MSEPYLIDLETAVKLVERGWSVVPCASDEEKRPQGKFTTAKSWREFSDRLPTEAELTEWFGTRPRRGGVVLHRGQLCVDRDTKETMPDGNAPWEETAHGSHEFFRCSPGLRPSHDHAAKNDYLTYGSFVRLCNPRCLLDWEGALPMWSAGEAKNDGTLSGWRILKQDGDKVYLNRPGAVHGGKVDAVMKVFSTGALGQLASAQEAPPPAAPAAVVDAADFVSGHPALPGALWERRVRRGDLFLVVGSPKSGKSWLASQLAIACAAGGQNMLGGDVAQGRVLLFDLELSPAVLAVRLAAQAKAMDVDMEGLRGQLLVACMRNAVGSFGTLAATVDAAGGEFALLIVDGCYKQLWADGLNENDNAQVADFCARYAALAEKTGAAVCLTLHRRKQTGQNAVQTVDEAVGAGAWGRSCDSIHVLRRGKLPGQMELCSECRSFPMPAPLACVRRKGLWTVCS